MANFQVEISTPTIPTTLTIKLPSQKKGSPMTLDKFTPEQVADVAADWTKQLVEAHETAVAEAAKAELERAAAEADQPAEPAPAKKTGGKKTAAGKKG